MGLGVGVGGEGEGPLPQQLPAPVSQKSRKERLLQRACALQALCGKPRLLPTPFPSCSQRLVPSRHSNPPSFLR